MGSTAAVIVTYGNRAGLCLQVAAAAKANGVQEIIIVDNGSPNKNFELLKQAATENHQIRLLRQDDNLGSAGGIARGLAEAIDLKPENIWLLDDDNLPKDNCLTSLLNAQQSMKPDFRSLVLYCYRGSTRHEDLAAVADGTIKRYRKNSFLAFSLISRLSKKLRPRYLKTLVSYPVIRTSFGPYGGMFAERKIFERLGMPRQDYYLYADDHEYCDRMQKLNINQFLIYSAQVDDLDISASGLHGILDPSGSNLKIYYQVRNHTHLGLSNISCRICYEVNKILFILLHVFLARKKIASSPMLVVNRLRLVMAAISDGQNSRLGRRSIDDE